MGAPKRRQDFYISDRRLGGALEAVENGTMALLVLSRVFPAAAGLGSAFFPRHGASSSMAIWPGCWQRKHLPSDRNCSRNSTECWLAPWYPRGECFTLWECYFRDRESRDFKLLLDRSDPSVK